ncbi:MAG: hypothetical protein ABH883_00080 [Candidatus Omnitrophota bacterium]
MKRITHTLSLFHGALAPPWGWEHEWEWSSAGFHAGEKKESILALSELADIMDIKDIIWKEYIADKDDPQEMDEIRKCTMLGRPWGGSDFKKALSELLGISLDVRKKGRPGNKKCVCLMGVGFLERF